jgi:hypothetical protein
LHFLIIDFVLYEVDRGRDKQLFRCGALGCKCSDAYKNGTGQMMNEVMTPFQHLIWKAMHMQSN